MSNFQSYGNNLTVSYYMIKIDRIPKHVQMEGSAMLTEQNGIARRTETWLGAQNSPAVARNSVCYKTISLYIKCVCLWLVSPQW